MRIRLFLIIFFASGPSAAHPLDLRELARLRPRDAERIIRDTTISSDEEVLRIIDLAFLPKSAFGDFSSETDTGIRLSDIHRMQLAAREKLKEVSQFSALATNHLGRVLYNAENFSDKLSINEAAVFDGNIYRPLINLTHLIRGNTRDLWMKEVFPSIATPEGMQTKWIPTSMTGVIWTTAEGHEWFKKGTEGSIRVSLELKEGYGFFDLYNVLHTNLWGAWAVANAAKLNRPESNGFSIEQSREMRDFGLPYHSDFYRQYKLAGYVDTGYDKPSFAIADAYSIRRLGVKLPEDFGNNDFFFEYGDSNGACKKLEDKIRRYLEAIVPKNGQI